MAGGGDKGLLLLVGLHQGGDYLSRNKSQHHSGQNGPAQGYQDQHFSGVPEHLQR